MLNVYVFLFICTTLATTSQNCIYIGNNILKWKIQNQTISIHAQLWRGASGWAAISFTNSSQTLQNPNITWTAVAFNKSLHEYAGLPSVTKNAYNIPKQHSSLVGDWKVWTFEPENRDHVTIAFNRTLIGKFGFRFADCPQLTVIAYNRKYPPYKNGTFTDVTLPPMSKEINFYQSSKQLVYISVLMSIGVCPQWNSEADLSSLHILVAFIIMLVDGLIFVILIMSRKAQPLKSRGTIPFLMILIHFLITWTSFTESDYVLEFTKEWKVNYLCFVHQFFLYPLMISALILIPLQLFR